MSDKTITRTIPTVMPDRPGPVFLDDPAHPDYVVPPTESVGAASAAIASAATPDDAPAKPARKPRNQE